MAEYVTVACKIPNGIYLRAFQFETEPQQTPLGVRDVKVARFVNGSQIKIYGPAAYAGKMPVNERGEMIEVSNGYALTRNVPAEIWDQWLADNQKSMMVQNKLIFAAMRNQDMNSRTREVEKQLSGLEPLQPDSDPRIPRVPTRGQAGTISAVSKA